MHALRAPPPYVLHPTPSTVPPLVPGTPLAQGKRSCCNSDVAFHAMNTMENGMHSTNFAALSLAALRAVCMAERQDRSNETSPACVELFRRAFAGDEQAWASACALFE